MGIGWRRGLNKSLSYDITESTCYIDEHGNMEIFYGLKFPYDYVCLKRKHHIKSFGKIFNLTKYKSSDITFVLLGVRVLCLDYIYYK